MYGEKHNFRTILDTCNKKLRVFKIPQKLDTFLAVSGHRGEAKLRFIFPSGYEHECLRVKIRTFTFLADI